MAANPFFSSLQPESLVRSASMIVIEILRQTRGLAVKSGMLLSTSMPDPFVLRLDFVEAIQHFAARPKHCNTQCEDQKGGHFYFLPAARASYVAASRSSMTSA